MNPSRAVVTIVHDEGVFLPIWLAYYGQFFSPQDMYVLDHESTDGSTDGDGFVRERVEHDGVDHRWMRNMIQAKQHELLDSYEVVLIGDVDEIVAPDPTTGTLGDYIDRFDTEFVNCIGYEVLHQPDEPAYTPALPVLNQRGSWFQNHAYSKPVLAREPMRWLIGFHARKDGQANFDRSLHLIHLHRMDYELCRARHGIRRDMNWGEQDLAGRWAFQNRLTEGDEFDRWFYGDTYSSSPLNLEKIPTQWRDVV